MKRIKKIVLKDATKLTNSEMKQIRGGYEPERSSTCSMECPVEYGGSSVSVTCDNNDYCDLMTNSFGVTCYDRILHTPIHDKDTPCLKPEEDAK